MKKKILLWILLLSWMSVIFLFSAQNADASSHLSSGFLHRFVLVFLPEKAAGNQELVHTLEFLLRKGAHMTEYAILAIIASALSRQYKPVNFRKTIPADFQADTINTEKVRKPLLHRPFFQLFLTCCFIFLYACTDEFHQLFISGRSGQFKDVLIDTAGGLLGGLFSLLCSYFLWKRHNRVH